MKERLCVDLELNQRLKAAQFVRSLLRPNSYAIVVEHDLSVLDYLLPCQTSFAVFMGSLVHMELLPLESLTFKFAETPQESAEEIETETYACYGYPTMTKTQGNFRLRVVEGEFTDSQIIFVSDVLKPLQIEQLMDQELVNLSGGELQRVALTLFLEKREGSDGNHVRLVEKQERLSDYISKDNYRGKCGIFTSTLDEVLLGEVLVGANAWEDLLIPAAFDCRWDNPLPYQEEDPKLTPL
ncbi:hypothetical protein RHGRI_007144 [Rhododendron griersonianum]|uniref:ABC transporter domain-containing protein n=1 Tax=Rhododendron griersonianum TaxID=479676 RepID=A0AAV6KVX2_9ERIC|nr:hypothetical protein RHGRI_007144 [Rhododendron griersonianum]